MANELNIKWKDEKAAAYYLNANNLHEIHPMINARETPFIEWYAADKLKIKAHTAIKIINDNVHKVFQTGNSDVIIDIDDNLDTGSIAAGTDYYVYICDEEDGTASIVISANSSYPSGYDADSSRKIGGFHTLCVANGTIGGHDLTGFLAGAILPASVWDLTHRPECEPEGMVWSEKAQIWVDIYLQSGTGASTVSVYGATITDTRTWFDHLDDMAAVGKRLLHDHEFQVIAGGSNEETNIAGSADPVTTGGHSDTASRRMISNIGCEDCCGALWQWLLDGGYRFDGAANHTHQVTVSGDPETVTSGNPSGDVAPAWDWYDLPGSKGSLYRQGTYGNIRFLAGGYWNAGTVCGSRSRHAAGYPWVAGSDIAGRGCARSRNT